MKKNKLLLPALFCSGAAALIYEVVWIRPIGTVFDSTVFVVSIITTSFMGGMALGSFLCSRHIDKARNPLLLYALFEMGIGLYGILLLELFNLLANFNQRLIQIAMPFKYNIMLFLTVFLFLMVPTTLMGATFPAVTRIYVSDKIGKGVGELYTANNLGAILGSLAGGFILIPALGIKGSVIFAAALNFIAAFLALLICDKKLIKVFPIGVLLFLLLTGISGYGITNLYSKGFFGLFRHNYLSNFDIVHYKEGLYGTVIVAKHIDDPDIYRLMINGQGSSSLRGEDMRISALLGYVPRLLKPEKSTDTGKAMIVGFGIGGTSRVISRQFDTVSVEIEPEVVKTASFFERINKGVLEDPHHDIVYDDARNYLSTTENTFDVIVNHPLEPYKSFSSLLFTKEFFQLVKSKLTPDGLYTQWIPLYELTVDDFRDLSYTLSTEFQYQIAFSKIYESGYYGNELVVACSNEPIDVTPDDIRQFYDGLNEDDRNTMKLVKLERPEDMSNLLVYKTEEVNRFNKTGRLVTDDLPRTEYAAAINRIRLRSSKQQVYNVDEVIKAIKESKYKYMSQTDTIYSSGLYQYKHSYLHHLIIIDGKCCEPLSGLSFS